MWNVAEESNMIKINKKKFFLAVSVVLAATLSMLLTVVFLGNELVQAKTNSYEELRTFSQALELIKSEYVEEPEAEEIIHGAIRGMLTSLDAHSSFMSKRAYKEMNLDIRGEFEGVGIQISIRDSQLMIIAPIEDTPADRAGLAAGDKIMKIDDAWTKDMTIDEAVDGMRGRRGTKVRLLIQREGWAAPKEFPIIRGVIKVKSVKSRMLEGDIGYIKITQFQGKTSPEMEKAFRKLSAQGMKKLVLDLRNNPGGILDASVDISSMFLPKDKLVVYLQGRDKARRKDYLSTGQMFFKDEPVVILVNAGSASASEIVAGALQDSKRALIVGTQSFGKGSVQTVFPLEGGVGMRLTTAKYYTPRGRSIRNVGITPDIMVKLPTVKDPKEGDSVHVVVREKDLKRHLKNDTIKGKKKKKKKKGAAEETFRMEVIPKDDKDDVQLQKAISLLKTGNVHKYIAAAGKKKK